MTDQTQIVRNQTPSYTARVDSSGRIVVPAELRERLHFQCGDQLILREEAGSLRVKSYDQVLAEAQTFFADAAPSGVLLSEELISERRAEAAREAAEDSAGQ